MPFNSYRFVTKEFEVVRRLVLSNININKKEK